MLLACSSLFATTWALSALDLLELELEELVDIVNLFPGRVNLSSGCPGIFKPQSPPCLTFPIRKMSPAFLRPPKTKIRGLDLKYFPGQLISALPWKLFQSSGNTARWTPRLPEEHWDWEPLHSTPLAPMAPHTDLTPRVIALFHLKFLKKILYSQDRTATTHTFDLVVSIGVVNIIGGLWPR